MKNINLISYVIVFSILICLSSNQAFGQLKVKGETGKVIIGQDRLEDPIEVMNDILTASIFGREGFYNAGSKLAFGDFGRYEHWGWNVFVGEWGVLDSDQLWLHGKNGFYLTYGRGENNYELMSFNVNGDRRLHFKTELFTQGIKIPANEQNQQNVSIIKGSLEKVNAIEGITYNHNFFNNKSRSTSSSTGGAQGSSDKENTDKTFFTDLDDELNNYAPQKNGFNANQLKEFFPELVETDKNGNNYIDYTGLIPVLVEAIKEQSRVVTAQSLKIKEMEVLVGDNALNSSYTDSNFTTKTTTDTNAINSILANAFLYQNTPNPFTTTSEIKYFLPEGAMDSYIYVFNLQGNLLLTYTLSNNGFGSVVINGSSLSAGMYVYTLTIAGQQVETKRMILTK